MGNVKRSIQIEEVKDDVFSDDIKTTAIIEEIEAAEAAARKAKIEKQIENSQPSKAKLATEKIKSKFGKVKQSLSNKRKDIKTKTPKDPRVKKVSLKARISAAAKKINKLAPQGISKKTIVEACMAGALIVVGVEIWAWNFSHPLFSNHTNETVEVPVTGNVGSANDAMDDDSPFATEPATSTTEQAKDTSAENVKSEEKATSTNISTNNYTYTQRRTSTSSTSKQTSNSTATSQKSTINYGTTTDDNWNDSYDSNWPTYDEPAEQQGSEAGEGESGSTEETTNEEYDASNNDNENNTTD